MGLRPSEELDLGELLDCDDRSVCRQAGADHSVGWCSPEADSVAGRYVVGVEEDLCLGPAAEDRIAGVSGILEDRADGASEPGVAAAVRVLFGVACGGAGDVVVVEADGDGVVAEAAEVLGEDAAHDVGCFVVDVEDAELEAVGSFARVGVWSAVDDDIAVWCASSLVAPFADDLGVHGGADAGLDVLAFGFADAAEEAHQHGV
jgi:hypothetical protein